MENILIQNTTFDFGNVSGNMTIETKKMLKVYDARGAMLFTVATVCVYGLSIVAFIAGHTNRREHSKEEESQIHRYLKHTEQIRQQGIREDVLRFRSQLLADSVMNHFGACETTRRQSRVHRAHLFIDHCAVAPNSDDTNDDSDDVICSLISSENADNYKPKRHRKMGLAMIPEQLPFMDETSTRSLSFGEDTVPNETDITDEITLLDDTPTNRQLHDSDDSYVTTQQQDVFVV